MYIMIDTVTYQNTNNRIKMIVTINWNIKKTSAKLLLIRNIRHISFNDSLATIDDGN